MSEVICQYDDISLFPGVFFKLSIDLETQYAVIKRAFSRGTVGGEDFPLPGYGTSLYFELISKYFPTPKYNEWRLQNINLKQKISIHVHRHRN